MRFLRAFALATLYTVASATVLSIFIVRPGLTGHPRADFPDQIAGTAYRPYVTRPLVPVTVRAAQAILPDSIERRIADSLQDRRMVAILGWPRDDLSDYAVALAVLLGYFVAFAFTLRSLAARFYDLPPVLVNVSALIGLLFVPLFFSYYSYLYDPGTLLTISLATLAMTTRRFPWIAGAMALATINKETAILLVPAYALYSHIEEGSWHTARVTWLLAIWIAIRVLLGVVYADNPGSMVERHTDHTVWLFTEWPVRFLISISITAVLGAFVFHRWRAKPDFLRASLIVTSIPLFAASLLFGYADELRGYYECYPFVYLLALPSIYEAFGFTGTARKREAE